MGIDVNLIGEQREPEQQVVDSKNILAALASKNWIERSVTVCLRSNDPWGDTIFNQAQLPVLLAELNQIEQEQPDSAIKAHLRDVIRLVELANGRVHTYIEFSGD